MLLKINKTKNILKQLQELKCDDNNDNNDKNKNNK